MRGLCFDLDGTLGSYSADFAGFAALLRSELGLFQCDMNAFGAKLRAELRRDGPLDLALALSRLMTALEQRAPTDLVGLANAATAVYASDYRPKPGAVELIRRLAAGGTKLALISNGPDDLQRAALRALGLEGAFTAIIISGDRDVGARKPAPRPFELACTALELPPAAVTMVGDSFEADVTGAVEHGMAAIWVTQDHVGVVPAGWPVTLAPDLAAVAHLEVINALMGAGSGR